MSDDDSQQNFILGFVMALIALVIFFVVGIVLWHKGHNVAAAKPAPAAVVISAPPAGAAPRLAEVTETVTVVIPDGASIRVVDGVVNFYFATGSADLAPGAAEALAAVIKGVESGRKAVISGFHDTTGDAAINEQLAKKRAEMVRDVLVGLGVPAAKVDLQKPAVTAGSGNNAEARRVEVKLVD
ncbi:OmpA family protein [Variovorax sp. NFACC27]|uniref:OmpA family protein n=1 Tax=unclassified Variovorax TaxID=663243 RepID=UPI00089BE30F|nr:outer membrane protein OmpA-like peptidoglycan-associated protein [Variovorax paradoxus]SEF24914.1 Outer membrane protein OmpA [Variovorax sp. NFACC28]SEG31766.1 Outer membrane protein OmpA [Variovorax sp. NFACC29]SFC39975.1 Outer membrane protein OmpA [Variovorax sp. NFACC26]SFF89881.1 Outer membrane protein OmpA [Variovorax sp. NFACC27]